MNDRMNSLPSVFQVIGGFSVMLLLISCAPTPDDSTPSGSSEIEASAAVTPLSIGNITRIHRVGPFYLASQPGASDFKLLRDEGVQTVINLRPQAETPDMNEADVVENLGFTYYNVPIDGPNGLDATAINRVRELLRTADRPILLHCSSANRVGSVWFPFRVLDHNLPLETAVDEAKITGLRSSRLEKTARRYINEQQK